MINLDQMRLRLVCVGGSRGVSATPPNRAGGGEVRTASLMSLKGTKRQHSGHTVQIYSKSLVRAIGKVLRI